MPKVRHLALKQEYPVLVHKLKSMVEVFAVSGKSEREGIEIVALWDTGAEASVITPEAAQRLNLVPVDRIRVSGVNNISMADIVRVSVGLPNRVMIDDLPVSVCNLVQGVDFLIGMDIILSGDFSISNHGGKTLFTFAIPPFENKTDLNEKAVAVNKRNNL
jgi:predicted aspartyl protease